MPSTETLFRELMDREEIRETILRWSRAVDTADWDLLDSSWTADLDADFTPLGMPRCGAVELKAMLIASAAQFDAHHHVLSNLTFHKLKPAAARTSIMVTAWSRPVGGEPFMIRGWYHDHLRREADGWRICARAIEVSMASSDAPIPA